MPSRGVATRYWQRSGSCSRLGCLLWRWHPHPSATGTLWKSQPQDPWQVTNQYYFDLFWLLSKVFIYSLNSNYTIKKWEVDSQLFDRAYLNFCALWVSYSSKMWKLVKLLFTLLHFCQTLVVFESELHHVQGQIQGHHNLLFYISVITIDGDFKGVRHVFLQNTLPELGYTVFL